MIDFNLFYVDDCMYVAALSEADAVAHVREECGKDCAISVEPWSLDMKVETANVDDGEKPTKDSKKTERDYMHFGLYCPALEPIGQALTLRLVWRDDAYIRAMRRDLDTFNAMVDEYEDTLRYSEAKNGEHIAAALDAFHS